jgi:hypothetical protein
MSLNYPTFQVTFSSVSLLTTVLGYNLGNFFQPHSGRPDSLEAFGLTIFAVIESAFFRGC